MRELHSACQTKAKRSFMTVPTVFSSSSAFSRVVRGWRSVTASSSGRKVNRKNSFSSSGTPSRSEIGDGVSVLTGCYQESRIYQSLRMKRIYYEENSTTCFSDWMKTV